MKIGLKPFGLVLLGTILVAAIGIVITPAYSVTQWLDGFDSTPDHYVNWDEVRTRDGTIVADDAVYHQGGWSSKSTITSADAGKIAYAIRDFTAAQVLWLRYYFRTDMLPDTGADGNVILSGAIVADHYLAEAGLYVDGGQVKWALGTWEDGGWATEFSATPAPAVDTWYCVEVYVKVDATQGEYRLYVDGALVISKTNINNAGRGDPSQIRVGVTHSIGQTCTIHTDSVSVFNPHPPGFVIPEFPLGPFSAIIASVLAFWLFKRMQ